MTPAKLQDTDTDPQSFGDIEARYGRAKYAARKALEAANIQRRGRGQGRGIFRLNHKNVLYASLRVALKLTFLWQRGLRNYFDIRVVEQTWTLPRLPPAFDGYRILQLSDLHIDLHPDFEAALLRRIEGLDYDLAVATGDFRACTHSHHGPAAAATERVIAALKSPKFAVLGNHDTIDIAPHIERSGAQVLMNENVPLERNGQRCYLAGIDDPNFYCGHDLAKARDGIPDGACVVLLSHAPQTYREAAGLDYDLLLSGHTHGGQICLPGGFVVVHDHSCERRYLQGRWAYKSLQGYTARGVGGSGLPVRFNCPSEVTLHTLRRG